MQTNFSNYSTISFNNELWRKVKLNQWNLPAYLNLLLHYFEKISVQLYHFTHSLTAALDQLRVVASSTSNDPGSTNR